MSEFVNRLERELLAAGKRPQARRAGRRLIRDVRRAGPGVFVAMFAVAAVVFAVTVAAGLQHHSAATNTRVSPTSGSRALPPGFGRHACNLKQTRGRTILPPLIRSQAAPSRALLSVAGFLQRPATGADRINLKTVDRWPDEILGVYVRYVRVIRGPDRTRVAVVPAVICGGSASLRGGTRYATSFAPGPPPVPQEALFMRLVSAPPPPPKGPPPCPKGKTCPRATVFIGTVADIRSGTGGGYFEGLQVSVVPNGVARVVFVFPNHSSTITIHHNIGMDWIGGKTPISTTWYAADRKTIRTFTLQSETSNLPATHDVLDGKGIWVTSFGEKAEPVIHMLDFLLGRRPSKPYHPNHACDIEQESIWPELNPSMPALVAYFSHGRFVGYAYWAARHQSTAVLATAKGLRPGDRLSEGRRLYGREFRVSPAQGGSWSTTTKTGRVFGYTSGNPKGPRPMARPVASIEAGDVGCPSMTP